MKLPLWVYDYKQRRYVVFPFHLLETFPDGSRGFVYDPMNVAHGNMLQKFGHFFKREQDGIPTGITTGYSLGGRSIFYTTYKFTLKEPPEKPMPKGPRWYSKDDHQIKRYKRKGSRR